jgi:hypothetical protein
MPNRTGWLRCLLTILGFSLIASCSEPSLIGLDLQPLSDQPTWKIDTFEVTAFTVREDSLIMWSPTKNLIELPTLFLGSMNDAYVGASFAGFVSQLRIGNTITPSTFAGVTTPDSVILSFAYRGIDGDSSALHRISVYELNEKLVADSTYYSSRLLARGPVLGHTELVPKLADSVLVGSATLPPMLRIPLDTALGGRFMRQYTINPATFADNTAFNDFFKGVVLTDSADGVGSILNFASTSGYHRLTVYFSGNKSYEFIIDANAVRFSTFIHEYIAVNTDSLADDPLVVQSMAGLKDSLVIRNLSSLYSDGPVSISSAKLVFTAGAGTGTGNMSPHNNLLIFASDSIGKNVTTADATETTSYYGGAYSSTTGTYTFNVARYVQQTLNKIYTGTGSDYGLFLVAGGSTSNARRTVLQGGTAIRLVVHSTKLNP